MTSPTERQKELARLSRLLQSGNYNANTLARFRELVAAEVKPAIEAAMRPAVAQAQRREAARRAGVAAGRAAGERAGWQYVERLRRGKR